MFPFDDVIMKAYWFELGVVVVGTVKSYHLALFHWHSGNLSHDDVIKCKHFTRYWPFVRGIHRSLANSPHKGQWRRALMFSLICVWINDWANNREAGVLRRYRAHYDIIVMDIMFGQLFMKQACKTWKMDAFNRTGVGVRFQYKITTCQYMKSHCGDKTTPQLSCGGTKTNKAQQNVIHIFHGMYCARSSNSQIVLVMSVQITTQCEHLYNQCMVSGTSSDIRVVPWTISTMLIL